MQTIRELINYDATNIYWVDINEKYPTQYSAKHGEAMKQFYFDPLLCFGDYDNSCEVERANVRKFMELYGNDPNVIKLRGSYGYEAIGIALECSNQEIIETLAALADYPVLCEDTMHEVFNELESEAWTAYIEDDLQRKLKENFGADNVEVLDSDKLRELFYNKAEQINQCGKVEAGGIYYIDVEEIAAEISEEELKEICEVEKY
jgi:hypothetical protein